MVFISSSILVIRAVVVARSLCAFEYSVSVGLPGVHILPLTYEFIVASYTPLLASCVILSRRNLSLSAYSLVPGVPAHQAARAGVASLPLSLSKRVLLAVISRSL